MSVHQKNKREKRGTADEIYKNAGLGNDYVYVNCLKEKVESPSEMARRVSDRHFGVDRMD